MTTTPPRFGIPYDQWLTRVVNSYVAKGVPYSRIVRAVELALEELGGAEPVPTEDFSGVRPTYAEDPSETITRPMPLPPRRSVTLRLGTEPTPRDDLPRYERLSTQPPPPVDPVVERTATVLYHDREDGVAVYELDPPLMSIVDDASGAERGVTVRYAVASRDADYDRDGCPFHNVVTIEPCDVDGTPIAGAREMTRAETESFAVAWARLGYTVRARETVVGRRKAGA